MSKYRQSGGENARFRTDVSIKHRVSAERVTSTLIGRYSETQQQALSIVQIWQQDSSQTVHAFAVDYYSIVFFEVFFLLFWNEVKTLQVQDVSWVWKFSGMSGISGKLASMKTWALTSATSESTALDYEILQSHDRTKPIFIAISKEIS